MYVCTYILYQDVDLSRNMMGEQGFCQEKVVKNFDQKNVERLQIQWYAQFVRQIDKRSLH